MSELNLDAIEARANAAVPGPWYLVFSDWEDSVSIRQEESDGSRYRGSYVEVAASDQCAEDASPTAAFIAESRTDVPALVARVRALEKVIDNIGAVIDDPEGWGWSDHDGMLESIGNIVESTGRKVIWE